MPNAAAAVDAESATTQRLEDRYGTGKRRSFDRRFAWGAAGLLVAAGLGFLLFSGWQNSNQVSAQDIGYTHESELVVNAKFEVSAPPQTPVACAVEALNTSKATVGWKIVELPLTDQRTHTVTTRLVTTNPATAVTTRACWVVEDPAEGAQ
ncbi:DUF4307 domain-containing protein [Leucobacter chromiireducens]|uniref:DUF4307 domain-containing protein n=1 Tax=Leucobacter chromiireducens subsp. chromiireducens TaxID=660067 RepID=A0ABS1SQ89_9MICO|nr:DUF4307 domain-containing protein [Leucobacter chromiireducens subsp. chromiireducens]